MTCSQAAVSGVTKIPGARKSSSDCCQAHTWQPVSSKPDFISKQTIPHLSASTLSVTRVTPLWSALLSTDSSTLIRTSPAVACTYQQTKAVEVSCKLKSLYISVSIVCAPMSPMGACWDDKSSRRLLQNSGHPMLIAQANAPRNTDFSATTKAYQLHGTLETLR